ncbi:MAG: integration host factor subunit alpha [Deltaproteobacteria bacterium]|nr:MAG: integration host factor subunit alpha [Deltaproteobacteria bacterium]RLB83558.1 MAG: integration host factor subunit alpha [Deltaproteobacteria bacterium]
MTLTKGRLVESVRQRVFFVRKEKPLQRSLFPEMEHVYLSRKRAASIVDTVFELIKGSLEKGDDVLISGFGKFKVRFRWAKKGRNPQTGQSIIIPSRRTVTFHPSRKLREEMNAEPPRGGR